MKCEYHHEDGSRCERIATHLICANNRGSIAFEAEMDLGYEGTYICSYCLDHYEPDWRRTVLEGGIQNFIVIKLT